uniref:Uncharacterized protein n=2 Tax=Oryza glumipatula TaxID=40148 RepID=A0A0D9YSC6_9ORYZ
MGIPSFYRWLVNRYPSIVSPAKESRPADGIVVYDNLYLDMNQIIHYSFHPQDQMNAGTDVCAPTTVSEVFESMFDYLDRLFRIVRPRRLLYLAVDGVAPCAKMNGMRRGRRFAWASEEEEMQKISEGVSDPNVITPGTEFMEKISQALTYYIRARLNSSDPGWKHIMDADLIMLALASHEVHFSILREDNSQLTEADPEKQYLFLNIWVLREYLEIELKILDPVCEPDIERLIDDFIFICFLMGNDFIPHIPSLEMKEYALDLLIEVYKTTFNKMGGYIVNIEKESLKKSCRDVLREASESERLELSRKLEDLFFNEERPYDELRLGLPGWKSRFYREYFGVETSNKIGNLQNDMAQKYLEGLCWMLQYYLADVPSWSWYYPFYVAPFVSDLKSLCRFEISFTCISEEELLQATKELDKELSMHEMRRNTPRQEKIFLQRNSNAQALAKVIVQLQTSSCSPEQKLPIDSAISGLGGWLSPDGLSNGFFCSPLQNLQDITNDQAISAMFFNPEAGNPIPRLLSNVKVPDKTVTEADISRRLLWHTYPGSRPPPPIVERPDTIWKPISKPSAPREEHKNAGTGWMGRGRGNAALAAAETTTQLLTASSSSSSSYGHGAAGSRTAAETQRSSSSSSSRRGSRRADMVAPQSRNSRFDDGGAYGFRPLGIGSAPWTGDGSGGGHGRGSAQPRAGC